MACDFILHAELTLDKNFAQGLCQTTAGCRYTLREHDELVALTRGEIMFHLHAEVWTNPKYSKVKMITFRQASSLESVM